ncbi:MAG: ABC-F family ATP-binding cassette domain-containing protein [Rhodospirillaceae bacterium]|jgi:ATP-binding cassette subfamily F protein 3
MLHINDLSYRIGGRLLFDGASVHVPKGHKVGLVGRNGTGKTTLFRMILDEVAPDGGSIRLAGRTRIGCIAQEAPSGEASLLETVLAADTELAALTKEAETANDPNRIAEIHTRLADIDAHTATARAAAILAGLGFDEAGQARACSEFSGGWRMRVALAGTLFARPDLLLLDEPTNHLDLEATLWLENYLSTWPGTLIVISHDRDLLNRAVDTIVHLHNQKLTRYAGGYDRFERTRRENLSRQAALHSKQLDEQRRIQTFVDRFRAKATKARQAQSRLKMLARMEPIASVMEERTTTFTFPNPTDLSPPLIAMDRVTIGYDDKPVLSGLDLRIDHDDRIALLGANGNGKSTLMKLLAARLKPMDGKVTKSSKLKIGYFAQHQADELNLSSTPLETLTQRLEMTTESKVRAHLGRFGFGADKAETKIGDLSGGEKARLLFCLMSIEAPHILLLDEPTNHLDVDAREALVQGLNAYEGTVILVSHDTHLIKLISDRLWLIDDGRCEPFDGDLDDYRRLLLDQARQRRRESKTEKSNGHADKIDKKAERQERARAREQTAGFRKKAQAAEHKLEKLSQQKTEIEQQLADPSLYEGHSHDLRALNMKLADVEKAMEAAEQDWMNAEEKLAASQS